MEHVGNRASIRHVAAVLAKDVANLADRAIAVVGIDVEQDRDTAGAVAFERKLFIGRARQFARTALNGTLDVILRHVFGLGREDGSTQARVGVWISAAILGGNRNFLNQTGKNLAALGI